MKKILFIILPSLFLILGAGKNIAFPNTAEHAQNKKTVDDLKSSLEETKKVSEDKIDAQEESLSTGREIEIRLGQRVTLQGGEGIPVKTKTFKVILPENKGVLLYKPSEGSFTPTNETYVEWNWTELSDIYFYKVAINLDREQNCIFLTLYPIENGKTQPFIAITPQEQLDKEVSYADFSIKKDEEDANVLRFHGQSVGMNTYSFKRPFVRIK